MTKMGPVPLDISKNVSVTNVFKMLVAMRVTHVTPCVLLFTLTSIHSIYEITKIRDSETGWKEIQKI